MRNVMVSLTTLGVLLAGLALAQTTDLDRLIYRSGRYVAYLETIHLAAELYAGAWVGAPTDCPAPLLDSLREGGMTEVMVVCLPSLTDDVPALHAFLEEAVGALHVPVEAVGGWTQASRADLLFTMRAWRFEDGDPLAVGTLQTPLVPNYAIIFVVGD